MEGVNWINDKLLSFCSWFHNDFVAPFLSDEENNGFPIRILEAYDIDKAQNFLNKEDCAKRRTYVPDRMA